MPRSLAIDLARLQSLIGFAAKTSDALRLKLLARCQFENIGGGQSCMQLVVSSPRTTFLYQ